jgi:hypothetical protein
VDAILVEVNSWGTSSGGIDLSSNTQPSSTGQTAATALIGRGWTVTVDSPPLWQDDFERSNATGLTAVDNGWFALGSGDADIVSGDLVRTDSGGYAGVLNPAGGTLPADYKVTATIPDTAITGGFFGVATRWASGTGVAAFFDASMTSFAQLHICDADTYLHNQVIVTADNAFPVSWTTPTSGDHTMAVKMTGTTCQVYLDGVLVAHATISTNHVTDTGVGFVGEGEGRHVRSIAVTS